MFFNYLKPEPSMNSGLGIGDWGFKSEIQDPKSEIKTKLGFSEKLLKCLWFDKRFSQPLRTLDGKKITLLSPGWWNKSAGPDFLNATFQDEEGNILKGNVELHVNKKDWKRHGHAEDKNYRGVALHVFFRNDGGAEGPSQILQVEIAPFLSRTVEDFRAEIDPGAYPLKSDSVLGGCCPALRKEAPERVASLLEAAGEERFRGRSESFLKRLGPGGLDQLIYEGLMEALGYSQNSHAFLSLARKLPWEVLQESRKGLSPEDRFGTAQTLLLAASGLTPCEEKKSAPLSGEARAYLEKIRAGETWNLAGCRPFNRPEVRLAGIAALMERFEEKGPFRFFMDKIPRGTNTKGNHWKRINREMVRALTVDASRDFWSSRPAFTGKKSYKPRSLIGRGRAAVILVNAVFPVLLAGAAVTGDTVLEEAVRALYFHFPLLPENSVQKFMNTYLLGERYQRSSLVNSARRQQGLIHVYKKFCAANEKGCLDCGFLSSL